MKKFNRWVMALAVAGGIFSSTATTAFAYVPDPQQTEAATEPISENEGTVIPEQEAAGQTEGTPQEETQGGETPFSIPGNGEVLDDKTGDGTKEFLMIQTKNGNTFFLVLDRSSNTENVYMLSMVDENDLAEFLDETKTEEVPQVVIPEAEAELQEFLAKSGMPVASTLLGLSAVPTDSPQYVGMLGMHGNYGPNIKNRDCDLLIAIGMRFDDRVTGNPAHFGENAKVIHLEIDPAEIGKIIQADVPVAGNVRETLPLLTARIRRRDHGDWIAEFRACDRIEQERVIQPALHPAGGRIRMGEAVDTVARAYDNDAVLVTDVGQQQMFAARYFGFRRTRSLVTSGGLGTMGFGLPAAIGAKLGAPERNVVLFVGDGGLQMTIQELGTIFQSKVPVKIVLLNNSFLGMVRQWQELFYDSRYSFTELVNPDFGLIARANGLGYRCVERREELADAVAEMKESQGAFLLEVRVESEDNVFPMVPAGAPVAEIRLE